MHRVRVRSLQASITLTDREVHHLRVLRLAPGDSVRVFDGQGGEAQANIVRLEHSVAELQLEAHVDAVPETPQPITLAVALLKGDKLSDVVRAATELGVSRIQLLTTRYADVPEIRGAKLDRLARVAQEAARQSRRAVIPAVLPPLPLSALPASGQGYVAHPGSSAQITELLRWTEPLFVVSGPEGGFSEQEISLLKTRGYHAVTLGKRILRAETAPLALLGAIVATGV